MNTAPAPQRRTPTRTRAIRFGAVKPLFIERRGDVCRAGASRVMLAAALFMALTTGNANSAETTTPLRQWQAGELRDHVLVGKIWSQQAKGFVRLEQLGKVVVSADHVLLGEVHDNPDVHRVQAWALGLRGAARGGLTVVMEMLNDAQKPVLERVNKQSRDAAAAAGAQSGRKAEARSGAEPTPGANPGTLKLDAAAVLKQLQWNKTGWPDAKIYQPIFKAVLAANGTLHAGSSARKIVRKIGRQGYKSLSPARLKALQLNQPLPPVLVKELRTELQEGHCNLLPERAMPAMMKVQRYRDAVMAAVMAKASAANKGRGSALIAGNGHVRADRAVPRYLRAMAPDASIKVIAIMEVRAGETKAEDYVPGGDALGAASSQASSQQAGSHPAAVDFVVFVPRQARKDQCEELRKMFKKRKHKLKKKNKNKNAN